jgi:hypothetical protein
VKTKRLMCSALRCPMHSRATSERGPAFAVWFKTGFVWGLVVLNR